MTASSLKKQLKQLKQQMLKLWDKWRFHRFEQGADLSDIPKPKPKARKDVK